MKDLRRERWLQRGALSGVNLDHIELSGLDFSAADLQRTNFTGTTLSGVDFSRANLIEATLNYATLAQARFCEADLIKSKLIGSTVCKTDFCGANLEGADLAYSRLDPGSNCEDGEQFLFNERTQFPISHNNYDDELFHRLRDDVLKGDKDAIKRLTYRFTKLPISISTSELPRQLTEELEWTSRDSIIYATSFTRGSPYWFRPDIQIDPYWQAHERAFLRGIRVHRIFYVDDVNDLDRTIADLNPEVDRLFDRAKITSRQVIAQHVEYADKHTNYNVYVCDSSVVTSSPYATLVQDLVVLNDRDDPRVYYVNPHQPERSKAATISRTVVDINAYVVKFRELIELGHKRYTQSAKSFLEAN